MCALFGVNFSFLKSTVGKICDIYKVCFTIVDIVTTITTVTTVTTVTI